jgi:hypothetical protein
VKYESLRQITSCWVGQHKQGGYKIGASKEGLSLTGERGQDRCIHDVLQGIAAQVCRNEYKKIMIFVICWKRKRKELKHSVLSV